VKEEMNQKSIDAEKRLNSLIRDFVSIFKKLAAEFVSYKDYTQQELKVAEFVKEGYDKKVAYQQLQVAEYEECIRIPR
jgi:hypothetical protein